MNARPFSSLMLALVLCGAARAEIVSYCATGVAAAAPSAIAHGLALFDVFGEPSERASDHESRSAEVETFKAANLRDWASMFGPDKAELHEARAHGISAAAISPVRSLLAAKLGRFAALDGVNGSSPIFLSMPPGLDRGCAQGDIAQLPEPTVYSVLLGAVVMLVTLVRRRRMCASAAALAA